MGDIVLTTGTPAVRLPPRSPFDCLKQRPVGGAGRLRVLKQLEQVLLNARIEAMLRFGETSKNREPVVATPEDVFGTLAVLEEVLSGVVQAAKCGERDFCGQCCGIRNSAVDDELGIYRVLKWRLATNSRYWPDSACRSFSATVRRCI